MTTFPPGGESNGDHRHRSIRLLFGLFGFGFVGLVFASLIGVGPWTGVALFVGYVAGIVILGVRAILSYGRTSAAALKVVQERVATAVGGHERLATPAVAPAQASEKSAQQASATPARDRDAKDSSPSPTLTTGARLSGKRHRVSTMTSKAGRAGKCRDCGTVVRLNVAKVACLDWDGVDAYHFYCPDCYRGTDDPHYYTGQLLGSDGSAVIDQHSWEREG